MAKAGTQKKTNVADRDFSLSASIGERAGVRCRIQTAHATGNGNGAKGGIWWRSARTFGQESNPTTRRLTRMNPCVSNPKSEIGNPKLNGWGGNRLREDARWKFGVPPAGNANYAWVQNFIHHLAPTGMAGFVLANRSMSANQLRFAGDSTN
jgi:type I restriction enzyme M protein